MQLLIQVNREMERSEREGISLTLLTPADHSADEWITAVE